MFEGKIVKILNPTQAVINLGADDGIEEDQRFIIYELGEMIKDPVTNQDIEQLEIIKYKVKVIHTQKKISTVQSSETTIVKLPIYTPYGPLIGTSQFREEEQLKQLYAEDRDPRYNIKVGDLVKEAEV